MITITKCRTCRRKSAGSLMRLVPLLLILLLICEGAFAQGRSMKGLVTTSDGDPIAGVSVVVKGTTRGVTTDMKGEYSINLQESDKVLIFSFLGMVTREENIGNKHRIDVEMHDNAHDIETVVVDIGYGVARKVDLTGSVAMIDNKELVKSPATSVAEALTGKIAGLQITTTEGSLGADIQLKIRGSGSITQDSDPLYIIDGFPSDLGMSSIDPNQIESVVVLKDASSTAIYGARGANGVILITTKTGVPGKTRVTYNGSFGIRKIAKYLDVMGAYDYAVLRFEQLSTEEEFQSLEKSFGPWNQLYDNLKNVKGANWQKEIFGNTGFSQNHNINVEGGSDQTRFNASATYYDEKGILLKTHADRFMAKIGINHRTNNKKLRFAFNTSYVESTLEGDRQYGKTGKLVNAVMMRPINNVDPDLDTIMDEIIDDEGSGSANAWLQNPILQQKNEYRKTTKKSLLTNASVEWQIIKALSFKASGGIQYNTNISDRAYLANSSEALRSGGPKASISHEDDRKWNSQFILTYKQRFNKIHELTVMAGNELIGRTKRSLSAEAARFMSDAILIDNLGLGTEFGNPSSSAGEEAMASFFGRVNYSLHNRYIITASLRRDGTSVFAPKNHWGTFPSAAVAWRISEEQFLSNAKWIDNLKIRASYGEAGNNRIPSDQWRKMYGFNNYGVNNSNETSATSKNLPNPNLKWESLVSSNVGVDFAFFNNRINGTVELYLDQSKDLLMNSEIAPESGFTTQFMNIGKIENKGIEITLSSVNIDKKNFTWSTDFNISFNQNTIKALNGQERFFATTNFFRNDMGNHYVAQVGKSVGSIYGYVLHPNKFYRVEDFEEDPFNPGKYRLKPGIPYFAGTTPQPGMIRFQDLGDGNNMIDVKTLDADGNEIFVKTALIDADNDRTIIGNANPKFSGGINNTFRYKNWDLSVFMNFVYGNKILNGNRYRFTSSYTKGQNMLTEMRHRFMTMSPSGERLVTGSMKYENLEQLAIINKDATMWTPFNDTDKINSWNVEDGSFLRLNYVTIGYSLPRKWLSKVGVADMRLYFTGHNLAVITGYSGFDPEVDTHSSSNPLTTGMDYSAYPKSRQYVFGINITF